MKIQSCERLLNCEVLTPEQRLEQARWAQKCRNVWFTATGPSLTIETGGGVSGTNPAFIMAENPTFSEAVIVTEMLNLMDWGNKTNSALNTPRWILRVSEIGAEGVDALGLWGLTFPAPEEFLVAHEKNRSQVIDPAVGALPDTQGKSLGFVPYLLKPYQRLKVEWLQNINETASAMGTFFFTPQLGFRGVRVLGLDNPYSHMSKPSERQICDYIARSKPETFFLQIEIPFADLPGILNSKTFKTSEQDRPLLVLGATCNLEGCQADLFDDSEYYQFTKVDKQLTDRSNLGFVPYVAPPLNLWAPDSDFRNANVYNMWPVPHLLDRGATLRVVLTNGLLPNIAGTFQQQAATRSSQKARITFLCRTV